MTASQWRLSNAQTPTASVTLHKTVQLFKHVQSPVHWRLEQRKEDPQLFQQYVQRQPQGLLGEDIPATGSADSSGVGGMAPLYNQVQQSPSVAGAWQHSTGHRWAASADADEQQLQALQQAEQGQQLSNEAAVHLRPGLVQITRSGSKTATATEQASMLGCKDAGMLAAAFIRLLKQHTDAAAVRELAADSSSSNGSTFHTTSRSSTSSRITTPPPAAEAVEAAQAAADLQHDYHWQQLLGRTQQISTQLQPHQASVILYTCAKLGRPPAAQMLAALLQQLQPPQLLLLPPRGLTNTLWALAVIQHNPGPTWMHGFFHAAAPSVVSQQQEQQQQQQQQFNYHQLTSILWSLGKLRERPPAEWLQTLLAALQPNLHQLSPTQLSNTLWGLAQLSYRPNKTWINAWFRNSGRVLLCCTPDHLACMVGSMGLLRLDPSSGQWLVQLREAVLRQLGLMQPWHIATVFCGLAKRRSSQPPYWVRLLVVRQLRLLQSPEARPTSFAAGDPAGPVLQALARKSGAAAAAAAARLRPRDVAATVWALPRLLHPTAAAWARQPENASALHALAAASLPLLPSCSMAELVQLAVGFAGLKFYPGAHWLKVHENAVAAKHKELSTANVARLRAAVRVMWLDG